MFLRVKLWPSKLVDGGQTVFFSSKVLGLGIGIFFLPRLAVGLEDSAAFMVVLNWGNEGVSAVAVWSKVMGSGKFIFPLKISGAVKFKIKIIDLFNSTSFVYFKKEGSGKFFYFPEPRTEKIQNRKDNDR